jgi:ubiquinol-cytochrome c reductase cytochrome b subunit
LPFPALRTWLERRIGRGDSADVHRRGPQPGHGGLSLGVVLVFALGLQLATGTLLLLHFVPDPSGAFESVRGLMRDVPYGWLIRLLHAHGGNLLVALAFVHLFHTAFAGAYRDPRELVWLSGCALFVGLLAATLTGYVLPWSQMSYWATTVVTASAEYVPGVGPRLVRLLRGGELVDDATFRRAFAAHVALLPMLLMVGVAVHLALVRRRGLAGPGCSREGERTERPARSPSSPVRGRAAAVVAFLLLLFACVFFAPNLFLPAAHRVPADPFETPLDVKPEWYFLWSYALSRLVPGSVALLLQAAALGLLVALPFLDRRQGRSPRERTWILAVIASSLLALIALSVLGYLA